MASCSWCGAAVQADDWWRAHEPGDGEEEAVFCRLEHVVPWAMKGPGWARVVLVHHRAGHRIPETFESVEDLRAWAAAGGPWQ
jgi:hypothetical protein